MVVNEPTIVCNQLTDGQVNGAIEDTNYRQELKNLRNS